MHGHKRGHYYHVGWGYFCHYPTRKVTPGGCPRCHREWDVWKVTREAPPPHVSRNKVPPPRTHAKLAREGRVVRPLPPVERTRAVSARDILAAADRKLPANPLRLVNGADHDDGES